MIRDKWRDIRAEIEQDILDGVLEPGAKLPTETELVELYSAGRHSVRRAVEDLAKDGFLSVEQGRGTFVQPHTLLEYTIGKRTRLRRSLGGDGVEVSRETMGAERLEASKRVAEALQIEVGATVTATRRMTLANGVPVSYGTLYHDEARFSDFPERRLSMGSVSAVYASYGIEDYLRGSTQMHSRPARQIEAQTLRQHPSMPVIVVRSVDILLDGEPISYGQVIWSAARVRFTFGEDEE